MRFLLAHHLEASGAVVVQVGDGEKAIARITSETPPFALVVSDNRMPGTVSGVDVLRAAAAVDQQTALLMLTAHIDPEVAAQVKPLGAEAVDKEDLASVPDRWQAQAARRVS